MQNERNADTNSRGEKPGQPDKSNTPQRTMPFGRPEAAPTPGRQGAEVPGRTPAEVDPDSKKAYGPGGGSVESRGTDADVKRSRPAGTNIDDPSDAAGTQPHEDTIPR